MRWGWRWEPPRRALLLPEGLRGELVGWGIGSDILLCTFSFCRVRVRTLTAGKGAEARVYLFKGEGKKKVFVYIVISEKLFCDTVTKGCFMVYNNIVSADFSVTS